MATEKSAKLRQCSQESGATLCAGKGAGMDAACKLWPQINLSLSPNLGKVLPGGQGAPFPESLADACSSPALSLGDPRMVTPWLVSNALSCHFGFFPPS